MTPKTNKSEILYSQMVQSKLYISTQFPCINSLVALIGIKDQTSHIKKHKWFRKSFSQRWTIAQLLFITPNTSTQANFLP